MWRKGLIVICNKPKLERDNLRSEKLSVCHRELVLNPEKWEEGKPKQNKNTTHTKKPITTKKHTPNPFPLPSQIEVTLPLSSSLPSWDAKIKAFLFHSICKIYFALSMRNTLTTTLLPCCHKVTNKAVSWICEWFLEHRNFSGYHLVLKIEMVFLIYRKKRVLGSQKQVFSLLHAASTIPSWASAALPEDRDDSLEELQLWQKSARKVLQVEDWMTVFYVVINVVSKNEQTICPGDL